MLYAQWSSLPREPGTKFCVRKHETQQSYTRTWGLWILHVISMLDDSDISKT